MKAFFAALLIGLAPLSAMAADDYPKQPVKIIVGFGPGAGGDIQSRLLAEELRHELGGSFVVENMPGAGATIAMGFAANAAPDGYTLLFGTSSHSASPYLFKKLSYDPYTAFTPIVAVSNVPLAVAVDAKLPIKSVEDLRAFAKSSGAPVAYAYGNTVGRILGVDFIKKAGIQAIPIPYNSVPQATTDVIGGRIPLFFGDVSGIQAQVEGGQLRIIAIAAPERLKIMPDAPTYGEQGIEDLDLTAWTGIMAPAGLSPEIADKIAGAVTKILKKPEFREQVESKGGTLLDMAGDDFNAYLKNQFEVWAAKVSEAGIEPQ